MRRRSFAKWLALGAGSLTLDEVISADDADQPPTDEPADESADESADEPADADAATQGKQGDPVCVTDFEQLARRKLPRAVFEYISTGSEDGVTLEENTAAFRRIGVLPPVLHGVGDADLSTTVLGRRIALPVLLAPVAGLKLYHPEGARAAARAARAAGTICAVSSSACHSIEEVAQATDGPLWYQLYVPRDRGLARALVERAETAGYQAIIVTVDLGERKDADRRNRFGLPRDMLLKHLRDIGHRQLTDAMSYEELEAFNAEAWDISLSWKFIDWLKGVTRLPILVKGILLADDARRAVKAGVAGIVVSNHGGRRLDGMPATINRLELVAEAVDDRAELLLDSGIRRGTDVLKALALGARAVLVGRPYTWALAADGEAGVSQVIGFLKEELQNAMVSCGCHRVGDIRPELLLNLPGKAR